MKRLVWLFTILAAVAGLSACATASIQLDPSPPAATTPAASTPATTPPADSPASPSNSGVRPLAATSFMDSKPRKLLSVPMATQPFKLTSHWGKRVKLNRSRFKAARCGLGEGALALRFLFWEMQAVKLGAGFRVA